MAGGGGWLENLEIMLTQFNCNCLLELSLAKGRLFEKGRRAGEGRGCSTVQGHQGGRGGRGGQGSSLLRFPVDCLLIGQRRREN